MSDIVPWSSPSTSIEAAFGAAILCDGEVCYVEQLLKRNDFIIPLVGSSANLRIRPSHIRAEIGGRLVDRQELLAIPLAGEDLFVTENDLATYATAARSLFEGVVAFCETHRDDQFPVADQARLLLAAHAASRDERHHVLYLPVNTPPQA